MNHFVKYVILAALFFALLALREQYATWVAPSLFRE
jgi:hypothetical protein